MDDNNRVSEAMYVDLCRTVGTPTEVTIRRDVGDMNEMLKKPVELYKRQRSMMSGSFREGFRFKTSDMDWMYWICKHKLISEISQARLYDRTKHTIILMEDSDTPPGFVKLQLLTSTRDEIIASSAVPVNGRVYISNLSWQLQMFNQVNNAKQHQKVTSHGPCANALVGSVEFDHALCVAGTHWAALTRPWIERCFQHTWPPEPVLQDILENGYHCVPVGSKIVSGGNLLEWRLSFSQAERKLVSIMSHTQFLVYGLLKIFLKEIANHGVDEPLLCSYFLKTTVFWMIQVGPVEWRPDNLLNCFWKCFKYLIHCIYRGEFPNFFLPQNNMFINKVTGRPAAVLYQQLCQYYRMGVSCLLLSPTLRSFLEPALNNPTFRISFVEGEYMAMEDIDRVIYREIMRSIPDFEDFTDHFILLFTLERLALWSHPPTMH
jgi:hypothetical protein